MIYIYALLSYDPYFCESVSLNYSSLFPLTFSSFTPFSLKLSQGSIICCLQLFGSGLITGDYSKLLKIDKNLKIKQSTVLNQSFQGLLPYGLAEQH